MVREVIRLRLWHQLLIPHLPRAQLLGQHRECCALRGGGWGRPHATVNYVFDHPLTFLVSYHFVVMQKMTQRGYRVAPEWWLPGYRGRQLPKEDLADHFTVPSQVVYPEHDEAYLEECLANLEGKGIVIHPDSIRQFITQVG